MLPSPSLSSPPPQVRVGVGVFVLQIPTTNPQNPSFLMGKRIGSHGSGTYALPGGHLEFGESFEECATREVLEGEQILTNRTAHTSWVDVISFRGELVETGLHVKKVRFLTATNDYMPSEGRHYVTVFVVCEREDDGAEARVLEVEKCEGWEWFEWERLVEWVDGPGEEGRRGDERQLFLPLVNLVRQREGVIPGMEQ